jgi:hypothetical protein
MTRTAGDSDLPAIDRATMRRVPSVTAGIPAGQLVQGDWVDNGKPVVRRGRKATGLDHASGAPSQPGYRSSGRSAMRAGATVTSGARHVVGVGLQALIISAILATVALAMSAVYKPAGFVAGVDDAAAARGGKPAIAANGSFIAIDGGSDLWLGGTVTFSTEAVGLKGREWPMVLIKCWDGDGHVHYAQLDHPDARFVLGGGSSEWKEEGGDADCGATLHAYSRDDVRLLAGPVRFNAAG